MADDSTDNSTPKPRVRIVDAVACSIVIRRDDVEIVRAAQCQIEVQDTPKA